MARFSKSNRVAHAQMAYLGARKTRKPAARNIEQSYFRRIGFDNAMI